MGCGSSVSAQKPQARVPVVSPAKGGPRVAALAANLQEETAPAKSSGAGSLGDRGTPDVKVSSDAHEDYPCYGPTPPLDSVDEVQGRAEDRRSPSSASVSPRLSTTPRVDVVDATPTVMVPHTLSYSAMSSAPSDTSWKLGQDVPPATSGRLSLEVVQARSSKAASILSDTNYRRTLRHPSVAKLPDGSQVLDGFRHVFQKLEGGTGKLVTPYKLEAALQEWAQLLPVAARTRIAFVVTDIFSQLDADGDGAITWEEFESWVARFENDMGEEDEEALAELFDLCDTDGTGNISAQELMDAILLITDMQSSGSGHEALAPETAEAIVRDLDCKGTGGIELSEFTEVIHASWAKRVRTNSQPRMRSLTTTSKASASRGCADERGRAHLVLNFDINQTVLMIDSCTGANTTHLCSTVIANAAWGSIEEDEDGKPARWVLKCPEVLTYAPAEGLHTYKEYVELVNPLVTNERGEMNRAHDKKVKVLRRALLWKFTEPGQPGAALHPKLLEMQDSLRLPPGLAGTQQALDAGLDGECYCLLPSFLRMLRELKRQERSFTLFFRTFGSDMEVVLKELNALCEGRHPLFQEEDYVVLDGSDGKSDYRMSLTTDGCGTFMRNPPEDVFALIMGTLRQPETREEGKLGSAFYGSSEDIKLIQGFGDVCAKVTELGNQRRTIALRDSYLGWSIVGSNSAGGKPLFLGDLNDPHRHSIFFDDNITATDPRIVDPIDPAHWPRRLRSSQLNGVHLVQAQPVDSISNPDYFLDCIRRCETARKEKLERWELVQKLLGNLVAVRRTLARLVKDPEMDKRKTFSYRPWLEMPIVRLASQVTTFDDDDEQESQGRPSRGSATAASTCRPAQLPEALAGAVPPLPALPELTLDGSAPGDDAAQAPPGVSEE